MKQALDFFKDVQRQDIKPDAITYSALISACSACEKGHETQKAVDLLKCIQEQAFVPNMISYNAAISACEKGQDLKHALEIFD